MRVYDVRNAGMRALVNALGPVGFARFIQQFENGHGNYTKEKYLAPEPTMDEIAAELSAMKNVCRKINRVGFWAKNEVRQGYAAKGKVRQGYRRFIEYQYSKLNDSCQNFIGNKSIFEHVKSKKICNGIFAVI